MKVTGFTIVRNAIKYDYPVTESIRSILPLCDEVVVAVGDSNDGTRELIESIGSPKIRIVDTVWDTSLRTGGHILAVETNKALHAVSRESDWAFYIQADEVVHEGYLENIRAGMERWKKIPQVEGLLFNFLHFWGSYDWVGDSRKWYRQEVRIIRPHQGIQSYKDAQGFRKGNRKIRVQPVDAWIYHYGWVKAPAAQQAKQKEFHTFWHTGEWMKKHVTDTPEFDYSVINILSPFSGTHPEIMSPRIRKKNWAYQPLAGFKSHSFRHLLLDTFENHTGIRIGEYRNYRIVRRWT